MMRSFEQITLKLLIFETVKLLETYFNIPLNFEAYNFFVDR